MSAPTTHSTTWREHHLAFEDTGRFSKLVIDYLRGEKTLSAFYHHSPQWTSFDDLIQSRQGFPIVHRESLGRLLRRQYADVSLTQAEEEGISALEKDAFTVTTGQQLVLAGGPMYVIYKALHAISLANALKRRYPSNTFVPIFWMATEDHDFDEIQAFRLFGKTLSAEGQAKTAVGRMRMPSNEAWLREVEEIIGVGERQSNIMRLLRDAYEHNGVTWTSATRRLLHGLFGEYGLIALDADEVALKTHASDLFMLELEQGKLAEALKNQSQKLEALYRVQAFPRDVNLFYLTDEQRVRISRTEGGFLLDGQAEPIPHQKMLEEVQQNPERFSPNVLLRPLYQETVLPNLAYIGGGAEVAYWMQLGKAFNEAGIKMPMVLLRNSLQFIDKVQAKTREKAGLSLADLFRDADELTKAHVVQHSALDLDLNTYVERTMRNFNEIYELAKQTDKSMLGAVEAQRTKQLKGLENLKKKLLRAEKKRLRTQVERIERLLDSLFPGGGLQERQLNWIEADLMMGGKLMEQLLPLMRPLSDAFTIVELEGE